MEKNFTQHDSRLIKKCLEGDRKSQKQLYDAYAPKMYPLCLKFFNRSSDADDVLQEGFIKLFNNLHTYRGIGSFDGWVRRVFVNAAIEFSRKHKKHLQCANEVPAFLPCESYSALDHLYMKDIFRLKNKLSDGYKTVFNLYAIEGYTHKEIGEILGITENTSKSQYSRAKASMRGAMSSERY